LEEVVVEGERVLLAWYAGPPSEPGSAPEGTRHPRAIELTSREASSVFGNMPKL
jgi:hypothetical protein